MAGRKYVSDYRLDKHLTESGKVKSTPVYRGDYFIYCRTPEQIRRLSLTVLLAGAAVVALLLPLLFNNTRIGRTIWSLAPIILVVVPLWRLITAGTRLRRFQAPLTREQKDQVDKGLRRSCMWLTITLAIHFAGCVVYCFVPGLQGGTNEWIVVLSIGLALAVSVFLLTQRNKSKTQMIKK